MVTIAVVCFLFSIYLHLHAYPHTRIHSWTALHEEGIAHLNTVVPWSIEQSNGCLIGSFLGVGVSPPQLLPLVQLGSLYRFQLLWISSLMVAHSSRIKWIWCWLACCYRCCYYSLDVINSDVLLDLLKWCFMAWMDVFEYYFLQQQRFWDYENEAYNIVIVYGLGVISAAP